MAFYIVTGKLGSGKTLCAVGRIKEYLESGRRVATNLDLNLEYLTSSKKNNVVRMPDRPGIQEFDFLGTGYEGDYDEAKFGAIVLDECASWLNTRSWNDAGRKEVINWLIHSRKKGWDVFLIIQDVEAIDKQIRDLFCEHLVVCRRMDRMPISFIKFLPVVAVMLIVFGFSYGVQAVIWPCLFIAVLVGLTSGRVPLPRIHIAKVHYGQNESEPVVDRWIYRGDALIHAYDTRQRFFERDSVLSTGLASWLNLIPKVKKPFNFQAGFVAISVVCFLLSGVFFYADKAIAQANSIIPKASKPTEKTPQKSADAKAEKDKPLPLRIAGSLAKGDGSFTYFFARGNEPVPEDESRNWYVIAIHGCSAMVTQSGQSEEVSCAWTDTAHVSPGELDHAPAG